MSKEERGKRKEEREGIGARDGANGSDNSQLEGIEHGDVTASPVSATRRTLVQLLAAAPLASFAISVLDIERVADVTANTLASLAERNAQFKPKFFTAQEYQTVRVLSDLVIPRDARSGGATDAGVPEFMDFMVTEYPTMQRWMRDGLAWLDGESNRRYTKTFVASAPAERTAILDDIAWPKKAPAEMQNGVNFFNRFRDLTASGFWSSKIGVQDLRYIGNTAVATWAGCPPAALRKLGVGYGPVK